MGHKFGKTTQFFPVSKSTPALDQKGQSLMEFILLMLMVIGLSYSYMKIVNGNLAKRWTMMVNYIVMDGKEEDPSRTKASID